MSDMIINHDDLAFLLTIERFRKAANCTRIEVVEHMISLVHAKVDQDFEDFKTAEVPEIINIMMEYEKPIRVDLSV